MAGRDEANKQGFAGKHIEVLWRVLVPKIAMCYVKRRKTFTRSSKAFTAIFAIRSKYYLKGRISRTI